jgi:aryl-alcohol dehydrogenase-like predicted oxidoreductase
MEFRPFGNTGLQISALSLGTAAFGMNYGISPDASKTGGLPPPSGADCAMLVQRALDSGINLIDTARAYGDSEVVLGEALQGQRQRTFIATKVHCLDRRGAPLRGSALRARVQASVRKSLEALKTDHVDMLLIHSAPPTLLQSNEVIDVLREVKSRGWTRYVGASTYGQEAPRLAIEHHLDVIQVAYNVFDRRLEDTILPLARQHGVAVVVRSVYLKGALTERGDDLPEHLGQLTDLSRRFRQIAAQYELAPADLALRFVLTNPAVASALVGVRSVAELDLALQSAAQGPLPPNILADLDPLRTDDVQLVDPSRWGIP